MAPPVVPPAPRSQNGALDADGLPVKKRKNSGARRLRKALNKISEVNAALLTENSQLRTELTHFHDKVLSGNDSHQLEVTRLKKEIEYHKRLREGAEQRCHEFEEQLRNQERKTEIIDEAQDGLIEQSQLLMQKNSQLTNKIGALEGEANQLKSLNDCLEAELADLYADRDRLAEVLEQIVAMQQGQNHSKEVFDILEGDGAGEGDDDDEDDDAEGGV